MENQTLTSIWASSELTEEEKIMLSKRIAQEMKEAESRKEYDETYDKYTEKQKPIVKKAREQAAENKLNVEQINYNGSLKEKMEILGCLRNKNGDRQYSKAYLNSMRGSELMAMYEDNMRDMKEAMEKAKEERAKIKAEGKEIFEDYNLNETEENNTEPEPKETDEAVEESTIDDSANDTPKLKEDLDALAEKMTDEEMEYVLAIHDIAKTEGISLLEAEKLYKAESENEKDQEEVNPVETQDEQEHVPSVSAPEAEEGKENIPSDKVLIESLGIEGVAKKRYPDGTVLVRPDGREKDILVPIDDIGLLKRGKEKKESESLTEEVPPKTITPKQEAMFAQNKIDDDELKQKILNGNVVKQEDNVTTISTDEDGRELVQLYIDDTPEPKKKVVKIVNKVLDVFKKAFNRIKNVTIREPKVEENMATQEEIKGSLPEMEEEQSISAHLDSNLEEQPNNDYGLQK